MTTTARLLAVAHLLTEAGVTDAAVNTYRAAAAEHVQVTCSRPDAETLAALVGATHAGDYPLGDNPWSAWEGRLDGYALTVRGEDRPS